VMLALARSCCPALPCHHPCLLPASNLQKAALADDPERQELAAAAEEQALMIVGKLRGDVESLTEAIGPLARYVDDPNVEPQQQLPQQDPPPPPPPEPSGLQEE
jgi:hypothetical protein